MERLVHWYESVARVDVTGINNAVRAVVPIRAVEALVADTVDVLITTITDGVVSHIASWGQQGLGDEVEISILNGGCESVLGMVTMLNRQMARNAKIVVLTRQAGDEVLLGQFCSTC